MATTFQAEVEALTNITIGAAGAPVDGQIDSWCAEGAKDIINRIKKSAPDTLPLYASDLNLVENLPPSHTGVVVGDSGGWLRFLVANHGIEPGDRLMIRNGTGPLADIENVYATVSNLDWNVHYFQMIGIVTPPGWTGNQTCDVGPPEDHQILSTTIESGIVLDASRSVWETNAVRMKACDKLDQRDYYLADEEEGIHYRSKYNPGYYFDGKRMHFVPELNVAYGEIGYVRAVQYPEIDSGTDNIGEILEFDPAKQQYISIYAAIKVLEFMIAKMDPEITLNAFTPGFSAPSAPALPTYVFSDSSLDGNPGTLLGLGSILATAPEYNGGAAIGLTTALQTFANFHSSAFSMDIDDLATLATVSVPEPSGSLFAPTVGPITSAATASDIVTKVNLLTPPTYTSQSGVIPAWTFNDEPDFTALTVPTWGLDTSLNALTATMVTQVNAMSTLVVPTPWNEQTDAQVDPSVSSPGFEETIGVSWEHVNDALENEDFEEAASHMTKISTRVSNQQQMFTQQMEEYSKDFAVLEKDIEHNNKVTWERTLAAWKDKVEFYKMQVQDVYTTYGHNLTRETSKWTNTASQNMALFGQEMADSLNIFNSEVAAFEKDVEAIQLDIKNEIEIASKNLDVAKEIAIQNSIAAYKAGLDQYQQDIANYGGSVTKYSRDVQFHVEKYNSEFQAYTDTWKSQQQFLMEENKNAAAEAVNLFNKENVVYQAAVQLGLAEFNSEAEALIKKMELSTDLANQNKAKKLEGEIQQYNAIMDRYVGEIQAFQHKVNYEVNAYAQDIAKAQFDQSTVQLDYTWYQDKYNRLVGEYESAFSTGAPAPPQAVPQGA